MIANISTTLLQPFNKIKEIDKYFLNLSIYWLY